MTKKKTESPKKSDIPDIPRGEIETAFQIRHKSLSERQLVEIKIQDGVIIETIEHEPDLGRIVLGKLIQTLIK